MSDETDLTLSRDLLEALGVETGNGRNQERVDGVAAVLARLRASCVVEQRTANPEARCFHVEAGRRCTRYLEGSEAEREAIVKWLRTLDPGGVYPLNCADMIEKGWHVGQHPQQIEQRRQEKDHGEETTAEGTGVPRDDQAGAPREEPRVRARQGAQGAAPGVSNAEPVRGTLSDAQLEAVVDGQRRRIAELCEVNAIRHARIAELEETIAKVTCAPVPSPRPETASPEVAELQMLNTVRTSAIQMCLDVIEEMQGEGINTGSEAYARIEALLALDGKSTDP